MILLSLSSVKRLCIYPAPVQGSVLQPSSSISPDKIIRKISVNEKGRYREQVLHSSYLHVSRPCDASMPAHQDLPSHPRGRTPSPTSPVSLSPTQSRVQSPERTITNLERKYSPGDDFGEGGTSRTCYTDQEFSDIAKLLKESNRHSWSRVPRIYTVLRLIDQLKALDSFLDIGLNDLWLPFNISQLPQSMSAHHRTRFLEQQNVIL